MSVTMQGARKGRTALAAAPASDAGYGAASRRRRPPPRRISWWTAGLLILLAAFMSGQALAVQVSLRRATSVHYAEPAPQPQEPGQHGTAQHYYYATAFDSGLRRGIGPDTVHVRFYASTDRLINKSDHSLTEIYTRDAAGNAVEVGVTTDTFWLPNSKPHLFVSSWTDNKWNGYDADAGFVETSSSATPGVTEPPLGAYTEYGYKYSRGKMWISYHDVYIGYFPASIWPGGWGTATESQTYAEVYAANTASRALPTMNGSVRGYATSTGSHFADFTTSSPYKIFTRTSHSFSFSCHTTCHQA